MFLLTYDQSTAPTNITPQDAPGLQRLMESLALSIQQKKQEKYRQNGLFWSAIFYIALVNNLLWLTNEKICIIMCFYLFTADSSKARHRIRSKIQKEKNKLNEVIGFYNMLVQEEEAVPAIDIILAAECPLWPWDKGMGLTCRFSYLL